jgi:hypothetical protein
MTTVAFDTLRLARKLQEGGFTQEQAQATAVALAESLGQGTVDVATKADVGDLRHDVEVVHRDVEGLRRDMASRADLAEAKAEILKWMFGAMVAQTGLIVALLKLLP